MRSIFLLLSCSLFQDTHGVESTQNDSHPVIAKSNVSQAGCVRPEIKRYQDEVTRLFNAKCFKRNDSDHCIPDTPMLALTKVCSHANQWSADDRGYKNGPTHSDFILEKTFIIFQDHVNNVSKQSLSIEECLGGLIRNTNTKESDCLKVLVLNGLSQVASAARLRSEQLSKVLELINKSQNPIIQKTLLSICSERSVYISDIVKMLIEKNKKFANYIEAKGTSQLLKKMYNNLETTNSIYSYRNLLLDMSFRDIQDPKSEQKYTAICPLFKQWIERTGGQDVTANGVRTISIQTSNKVIKELEESVPDDLFSECSKIIFKRLKPNHTGAIAAKVSAEESKDASPLNRPDINQQQHPSNANKPMAPAQSTSISEHELKRYSQMEECEQAYAKLKKDHALIEKKAAKELEEATRIRARLIEEFTRARDASLEKIKNNIDIMAKNN